jgi:putative membrane protein
MKLLKWVFLFVSLAVLVWSGIGPKDRITWLLETVPALIGIPLLVYLDRRYTVTPLLFVLICIHSIILSVGGHYTYAEVPWGFAVSEVFGWSRNHYDRLGHLFQGFEPMILSREVLLRQKVLAKPRWLFLYCVSICLAFSAFYELIEWSVALLSGEAAAAFLGTQGDPWDTQWDMFLALAGAIAAWVFLARSHRRQLDKLS